MWEGEVIRPVNEQFEDIFAKLVESNTIRPGSVNLSSV